MDSFEVNYFRKLKQLELQKLARVNLIVGKNNVGKTSVLDSIYVINSIENNSWAFDIDREQSPNAPDSRFRYLFYKFNGEMTFSILAKYQSIVPGGESQELLLRAFLDSRSGNLSISRNHVSKRKDAAELELNVSLNITGNNSPISFKIFYDPINQELAQVPYSQAAREFIVNGHSWLPFSTRRNTRLVTSKYDAVALSNELESLAVKRQLDSIIAVAKNVDGSIEGISLGATGQIYLDLGDDFSTLVPLSLSGDGVKRLIMISATLANTSGGIVLIDEIDNGLHYSALRILWRGILQVAREYDVQVFVTTHSAEAIRHLTWVLDDEEYKDYRDDVAAYTLIRAKDDTVRSFRYNYEQLDFAMEHDMEVRN